MVELLAPCGNIASLCSAVKGGANAVYLGLSNFNARLKADNFTNDNITEWVTYCHIHNVKVYVALNTCIKQSELALLDDIIITCERAGVDAFIITDLAILPLARRLAPHVELHASTQMGIHNLLGAQYIERLGFTRVVLSRECGLEEIKEIKQKTKLEVEYFVHGAMCVSFSGGCLFSSVATGNSGNRGACLQPCRKEYTESLTGSNGYMLSPKDQCLIDNIDQLISAGVDSLKIEGRMKSPEYVGLTCSKYSKIIKGMTLSTTDYSEIKRVYNRGGFSSGYAFSAKKDIMYKKLQGHMGEYIGKIISCTTGKNDTYKLKVKSNHEFSNGDGVKILRNGTEVGGMEISIIANDNGIYTLYSRQIYMEGDSIHITSDKALAIKVLATASPKINVSMTASFSSENGISITALVNNITVNYTDNTRIAIAMNAPMTEDNVITALSKCGDTDFIVKDVDVHIDGELFVQKSVLNNARREVIKLLYIEITRDIRNVIDYANNICYELKYKMLASKIICNPNNINISEYVSQNTDIVIDIEKYQQFSSSYPTIVGNVYVKLPKMAMTNDVVKIQNLLQGIPNNIGIYAENIYALEIAYIQNRCVLGGIGLNIFNTEHANILGLSSYIPSIELNNNDLSGFNNLASSIATYSYGRLPVMTFAHCPIINILGCSCATCKYKPFTLSDRYGVYPIERNKLANCYFTMYNSKITSTNDNKSNYSKFYDFSCNDEVDIKSILNCGSSK